MTSRKTRTEKLIDDRLDEIEQCKVVLGALHLTEQEHKDLFFYDDSFSEFYGLIERAVKIVEDRIRQHEEYLKEKYGYEV